MPEQEYQGEVTPVGYGIGVARSGHFGMHAVIDTRTGNTILPLYNTREKALTAAYRIAMERFDEGGDELMQEGGIVPGDNCDAGHHADEVRRLDIGGDAGAWLCHKHYLAEGGTEDGWDAAPIYDGMAEGGIVDEENGPWAVVVNMPGYLPEAEPAYFKTEAEAQAYAKEEEAELEEGSPYIVDVVQVYQGGAAVVENIGDGVPAIVGEAGPEAVIPLDDPAAVEVMAEAIEESGAESSEAEAVEGAAEAVEEAAEEVEEAAEEVDDASDRIIEVLERLADFASEEVDDSAEDVEEASEDVEEAAEDVEEAAEEVEKKHDVPPRSMHWSERPLREILFGRSR